MGLYTYLNDEKVIKINTLLKKGISKLNVAKIIGYTGERADKSMKKALRDNYDIEIVSTLVHIDDIDKTIDVRKREKYLKHKGETHIKKE